jgi:hypothetical protein
MEINEKEIRIVPLEDELKAKNKRKGGNASANKDPAKPVSQNGVPTKEDSVRIAEQYKERNWLVIMGSFVFMVFMLTFLSILAVQLIKLGDVDKTLQVFTTISVSVFAVVNPTIAYFFGKSRNK